MCGLAWLSLRRGGRTGPAPPERCAPDARDQLLVVQAFELHPILVCDPVCPTNNVAKGCYRIAQIQRVFQQAASAAIAAANAAVDVASVAGSECDLSSSGFFKISYGHSFSRSIDLL